MGGSTSLQNDGNPASTVWAEATQSGGPASNVLGTVDGSFQLNQWDGVTKKLLLQTIANAAVNNPSVKALATGMFMEILGSLLIDQNLTLANNQAQQWKDNGGVARKVLQVDNNNNTQLYGIAGLEIIQLLKSDGTVEVSISTANGNAIFNGTVSNVNGALTGFFFITPYHLTTNPTVNSGTTTTLTCTGVGGVPAGAKAVLIGGGCTASAVGGFTTLAPNGATLGQYGGVTCAVASQLTEFVQLLPIAANGKLDIHANAANIVLQDWYIIGYVI